MTGTTVGHYEILEKIGEGGMGQVYRARDLLLNRIAALKLLPAESAVSAQHDDRRARFIQEAQSASALNHPNIVTIYEVGRAEGRDFIAMELVQGKPLDEVIGAKPLSIDKVIAYGVQIADALAAAHAAGIVHRDLKPGNVMVTDAGLVKVLDFGLAKMVAPVSSDSDATRTVLAASPKTTEGMILGTVSYMSPEQAEGKPVGPGTDIFSFGALLYEMVTGRRAFQGESTVSTLAQVLTADPKPITTEVPALPRELSSIVARCLRKTPAKRWQSIADVRIALEEFKQDLDSGALAVSVPPRRSLGGGGWWMPVGITAVIAAAVVAFFALGRQPSVAAPEIWKLRRLTSDAGASMYPTLSRDGRMLAYASDRAGSMDLWVQQVDGGDPVRLTRDLGQCQEAEFSPDGSRLVVRCGTDPDVLYSVPTLGGLARKIGEGAWARFSPDGSTIAYVGHASSGSGNSFWIMPAQGGTAKEITQQRPVYGGAVWHPNGRGLFFMGGSKPPETAGGDWFFVPVDGGAETATGAVTRLQAAGLGLGRDLAITSGGFLFGDGTYDSSNLYRLPFDAAFNNPSGDVVPVTVGAGVSFQPSASQDGSKIAFAIAANIANNIWKASVDPATGAVIGQTSRVTSGLGFNRAPSPARDGKRVAYLGGSDTAPEVRVRDLASGSDRRLAEAKIWSFVVLSPDGSSVAYDSDQRNNSAIYVVSATGGQPRKVCAACGRPVEWLRGGQALLLDNGGRGVKALQLLDIATGKATPILEHPKFSLAMPRLSPDGRHVTFSQSLVGRNRRLYVAPFTGDLIPESAWTLLVDGTDLERQPFWSPTGQFIYFLSERDGSRCVWAQRVEPATGKAVGAPFAAYHAHAQRFSLEPIQEVAHIGLSVANGEMFLASFEMEPNIWLAERQQANQK